MDQAFNIDLRTNHGILPWYIMIYCEYLIIRGGVGGIGCIMGSVGPGL